jgi:multiple sugar transport system permease protein
MNNEHFAKPLSIEQKNKITGIAFILPSFLSLVLLIIYPLLNGFYVSFFNTNLVNRNIFVGLRYYIELLTQPDFYGTLLTTLEFCFLVVLGHFLVGGLFAGLLNNSFPGRTLFRVILVLPWVIPEVSVGLIWKWIFNPVYGLFNNYLLEWGWINEPVAWLSNPKTAFPIVVFISVWKGFPLIMLLITAGLQTLSNDILEAAKIDGANHMQSILRIVLPSLKPVMLSALVLDTLWWFKHFTLVWMTTAGGPENATNLVSIDIYKTAFEYFKYGEAAARSVLIFLICMIISLIQRRILNEKAG